ncbi:hypothetical protein LTR10_008046 [Elasticomyces elasticus]|nr:hypothetical protein LTR10_008046 [Elasticomyces elasticus]KAK4971044.1 hypothetical protein LTR42_008023 [Elasticomyces elasticus]
MDLSQLYAQLPLRHTNDIRAIQLNSNASPTETIRANMRVMSLESLEPYQCLSYAWESNTKTHAIACNEFSVPVTANLHAALVRIRERQCDTPDDNHEGYALWIDALCINQGHEEEKAQQIALMGHIYNKAERLLIWLGEPSHPEVFIKGIDWYFVKGTDHLGARSYLSTSSRKIPLEDENDALRQLLTRAWFRRRWVVQEVVQSAAHERLCLYGPFSFTFEQLSKALYPHFNVSPPMSLDRMQQLQSGYTVPSRVSLTSTEIEDAKAATKIAAQLVNSLGEPQESTTMFQNLLRYCDAECSLDHDRIHAMLSISSDHEHWAVKYDIDLTSLYWDSACQQAIAYVDARLALPAPQYPQE